LVDLLSLYRDVLTLQISANVALVNEDLRNGITEVASVSTAAETIHKLDAISEARLRIDSNVRDLMVLESLAVQLRRKAS
jgi:DNA polymerase-3 subunit delta'